MMAQLAVGIGGDVMKLVHGDQPVVENVHTEFVHGEAKCRVGTDQRFVTAGEERRHRDAK